MRIAIIVATVLLLSGAAAFFCGEWGPGVGEAGVVSTLVSACGMMLFGGSLVLFGAMFAAHHLRRFSCLTSEEKSATLKRLARQALVTCLNALVYGGVFVVAMGAVAALDAGGFGTVAIVVVVWACCIVAFVLYRRHRKAHRAHYDLIGSVAITAVFLLLGAGLMVGFAVDAGGVARDLERGPTRADVFLVDAKIDYPQWKYARILQVRHVLTFFTADEERIVLEVPEGDIDSAKAINDLGNFVHLAYYPNTQVLCNVERWNDGHQAMGAELLGRLNEEYDFVL